MARVRASGVLEWSGPGTWTTLTLDPAASRALGSRGKKRVRGTLNGSAFATTAVPNGDGTHSLLVTKPLQALASVGPGDRVTVEFEVLRGHAPVRLPAELSAALRASSEAAVRFSGLAPSHRRAWAEYVASAKKPETRRRRAGEALARIRSGSRNPRAETRARSAGA